MHHVILIAIKKVIIVSSFFSIFVDEVPIVDNQSWIFFHYYLVVGWKQVLILLTLEHLVEGGATVNIKNVTLIDLITYGNLTNEQIFEHFMCLKVDGVSTFQGV